MRESSSNQEINYEVYCEQLEEKNRDYAKRISQLEVENSTLRDKWNMRDKSATECFGKWRQAEVEVEKLKAENKSQREKIKKLEFMIENGLKWEDLNIGQGYE